MLDTAALMRVQAGVATGVLLLLWLLETWLPVFADRPCRIQHAGRNLVIAGIHLAVIGLLFSSAVAAAAAWAEGAHFGLLNQPLVPYWARLPLALLLFDAWMYLWHRAN